LRRGRGENTGHRQVMEPEMAKVAHSTICQSWGQADLCCTRASQRRSKINRLETVSVASLLLLQCQKFSTYRRRFLLHVDLDRRAANLTF
jgi:hypothetical protein